MSNLMEKAAAYLSKLEADRLAAMELTKQKELEVMLLKAREEGFRAAMKIFSSNVITKSSYNGIKEETDEGHKRRRRDIRQMIIKELSYSAKAMTTRQIAKAIDYLPDPTETTLKRLQNEGKTVQKWRGSLGGCCYKRRLVG
jgi:hypothetical protein